MKRVTSSLYRHNGGIIRRTENGWRAEINRGGKRNRHRCENQKEAEAWIDNELPRILENIEPLSVGQIEEYRAAVAKLPTGVSLLEAVLAFQSTANIPAVTVRESLRAT